MGSRDAQCYLGSPEVVAASAVAGYICGPRNLLRVPASITRHFEAFAVRVGRRRKSRSCRVSRARCSGRLVFLPQDNLNTDGIYGKDYTYREDMTPEMMARVVMENYDPQFACELAAGDVVVGGFNFGTGSSREQAVTALKCEGIPLVIAASFSQTYLRNAFNNGFLCIEVPELVKRLRRTVRGGRSRRKRKDRSFPAKRSSVDFAASIDPLWRSEKVLLSRRWAAVPQSLVIAGGDRRTWWQAPSWSLSVRA